MLICRASTLYMFDLLHLFYTIDILVLIWKLPNYLTQTSVNRSCLLHATRAARLRDRNVARTLHGHAGTVVTRPMNCYLALCCMHDSSHTHE
jgi:hypothetical protein